MAVEVTEENLDDLRQLAPLAEVMEDGGHTYVYMPTLKLPDGKTVEALLQLDGPDPYFTRLYLSQRTDKPLNWDLHQILNKTWHTWSWKDIKPEGRLIEIVRNHFEPLR